MEGKKHTILQNMWAHFAFSASQYYTKYQFMEPEIFNPTIHMVFVYSDCCQSNSVPED